MNVENRKEGKFKKNLYHISENRYHIKKTISQTINRYHKQIFQMIGDAHILRILSQNKGEIENSKRMGGLRNVSRYMIKHKSAI